MEYKSKYGVVYFHDTPWDSQELLGKSLEIDSLDFITSDYKELLFQFCENKSDQSYKFIASRIPCGSLDLKKVYLQCGFILVEHILNVTSFGLDVDKLTAIFKKFPVDVYDFSNADLSSVEEIASEEFKFGRFFEDPFINIQIAKRRNRRWVNDLINQNTIIKVLKKKNVVVGFMAYKINNYRADFVLGGVKKNYRHLSYGFWSNILLNLKDIKEFHTLISSSNIDVLNLYAYLGFKFENPMFGFHKHL